MSDIQKGFENWFFGLSGDFDESLLDKKDDKVNYKSEMVSGLWTAYFAGYKQSNDDLFL